MKVRLLAFATARQALGQNELEIELTEATTVEDLATILIAEYPDLAPLWPRLAIAVDGELVDAKTTLHENSEIALLPPVSGGARKSQAILVDDAIDLAALSASAGHPSCGAVLLFIGNVREQNRGRPVRRITYDAYRPMASKALERIGAELESSHPLLRIRIVHRLGAIPVGEASVAIAVASPHRESAYAASRKAIERLKREVPIWKLEHYMDGETSWREEEPLLRPLPDLV